ncbi:MAG: molybdate ABC transporter substrate-binding protein [Bryobacterales bacterium]|nr:molybdate ABC transporter substrate-binding protein [Bryobacterales bacterium]
MVLRTLQKDLPRAGDSRRLLSSISVSMLSALLSSLFACVALLPAQEKTPALVAAASDLAPLEAALRELAGTKGLAVKFVFGSSGQLANQIRGGAPYDVLLSANVDYVRSLESEGRLVTGSVKTYARGRLAIYSKRYKILNLQDLTAPKFRAIAIANPAHAPYGVAARQALQSRPEAEWKAVSPRLVYAENVRQALQFAESGNADAALVAWTLVKGREGAVLLPESAHPPILQAVGVVNARAADSDQTARALQFAALLTSRAGQALLRDAGFGPGLP